MASSINVSVNVVGWVQTSSGDGPVTDFSYLNAVGDLTVAVANDTPGRLAIGTLGQFLRVTGGTAVWETVDSDDIGEGASNLYWTNDRFDTRFGTALRS